MNERNKPMNNADKGPERELPEELLIMERLQKSLKPSRYLHTLSVAYTAAQLALIHGCDGKRALIAGLLHDVAKPLSDRELLDFCRSRGLTITPAEEKAPYLLHGKAGAEIAKEEYGIEDQEILQAIRHHTTGAPDMGLLEKLIFIADYIEPYRDKQPRLKKRRKQAFQDPDKALLKILKDTLEYLKDRNMPVDPQTEKTYLWYLQQKKEKLNEKRSGRKE